MPAPLQPPIDWTPYLTLKLEAYVALGMSAGEIAKEFGCSRSTICSKCQREGLRLLGGRHWRNVKKKYLP